MPCALSKLGKSAAKSLKRSCPDPLERCDFHYCVLEGRPIDFLVQNCTNGLAKEPPVLGFRHAVKVAGDLLETLAIVHVDFTAGSLDQLSALKIVNRFGHAGATNREHC